MENREHKVEHDPEFWDWANQKLRDEAHKPFEPIPLYKELELPVITPENTETPSFEVEITEIQF